MGNTAKRDAREVVHTERQQKALELRLAGATFQQVADKLGLSHRADARKLICKGLELYRERRDDAAEDLVEKILETYAERRARCRVLRVAYYTKAVRGDLKAAGLLLDVDREEREGDRDVRKILGLDAPVRTELTGRGGGALAVEVLEPNAQLLDRLARLAPEGGEGEAG